MSQIASSLNLAGNNVLYRNDKPGLIFGGFDATVGTVRFCQFLNNTL